MPKAAQRMVHYVARACQEFATPRVTLRVELLQQYLYGEREIRIVGKLCDPKKISLDVGAANGLYTYVLSKHSAGCIAFEPNPDSFASLKLRFNNSVQINNCALSSAAGRFLLRMPVVRSVAYTGFGTLERGDGALAEFRDAPISEIMVEVKTLDSFDISDVGFIKIDVEGHELETLRGAVVTLERWKPNLMIEIEERHKQGNLAKITDFFRSRGYGIFFLKDGFLQPITAFDPTVLQNPNGPIEPGIYFNNFFFLSRPNDYAALMRPPR